MEAAIFGFLGVIVGAAITVAGEYVSAHRRDSREDALFRAAAAIELRTAVRLVDAEFLEAAGLSLNALKNQGVWLQTPVLSTAEFERSKSTLAMHLSYEDWDKVRIAAGNIRMAGPLRDAPPSVESRAAAQSFLDDIMIAREVLKKLRA